MMFELDSKWVSVDGSVVKIIEVASELIHPYPIKARVWKSRKVRQYTSAGHCSTGERGHDLIEECE